MISEGTDIPRLQVCCHLSRIKTELHFRQVLGRVLRVSRAKNQEAFLYMPAEPTLVDYAERVAEHIPPGHEIVTFNKIEKSISVSNKNGHLFETGSLNTSELALEETDSLVDQSNSEVESIKTTNSLSQSYEASLNVFGRFYQEVMNLNIPQSRS
jgi:superfamily II DNA or RNA helicase